jgi:hypothetical protein
VTYTTNYFFLYHNGEELAQDSLIPGTDITCAAGSTWNVSLCEANTYTLTVIKSGLGTGTVTSSLAGINCGATCNAPYNYNTSVTLTATPDAGSVFSGWSGDCNSSGQVTMSSARSCTATFTVGAAPNLTASSPTPTTATINVAQTYSSTISNNGNATASGTITHLFQYDNDADHNSGVTNVTTTSSAILAGGTTSVSTSHTFTTPGTRYVRACADNNASFIGTVTESNENDNCSSAEWTSVVVTDSAAPNLTASSPTPTTATINVAQTYSSTISNNGNATASGTITHLFQYDNDADHNSGVTNVTTTSSAILAGGTTSVSTSHTFTTPGTRYVRACADNNASFIGTVTESNENDNCSSAEWTSVVVTDLSTPSGTITVTPSCEIAINASTCNSSITWTTQNLTGNPTEVTHNNPDGTHVSWLTSGTNVSTPVKFGLTTFYLYHNSVQLDSSSTDATNATCAVGSTWNGTTCVADTSPSGTITATDCISSISR